ncbi:inner membrane protein, partial [Alcaligenes faecalis subsp. faecalis NCIB 8687]
MLGNLVGANSTEFDPSAVHPVMFDSSLLIMLGMLYNRLTGVAYPPVHKPATRAVTTPSRFTDQDYDAALIHYKQTLNISHDDLEKLVSYVHQSAFRRNLGTRRCASLMNWSVVISGILYWNLILDRRPSPPARLSVGGRILSPVITMVPQMIEVSVFSAMPAKGRRSRSKRP